MSDAKEKLAFRRAQQKAVRTGNYDQLEAMMERHAQQSKGKQAELMRGLNEVAKVLQGKGDASSKRAALKQLSSEMSPETGDQLKNILATGGGGTGAMMAELRRTIAEAEAADAAAEANGASPAAASALTAAQKRNRKKRAKAKAKRKARREAVDSVAEVCGQAVDELLEHQGGASGAADGGEDEERQRRRAKNRAKNRRRREVDRERRAQAREEHDREKAAMEQLKKMEGMFEGTPMAGMMEKMLAGGAGGFDALEKLMTPGGKAPDAVADSSSSDDDDVEYEEDPEFKGDGSVTLEENAKVAMVDELLRARREGREALFAQQLPVGDAEVAEAERCVATLGVNDAHEV